MQKSEIQQWETSMIEKKEIRAVFRKKREALSLVRRKEASEKLFSFFSPKVEKSTWVLSFFSAFSEIDLSFFNQKLCREKKLILPKVTGEKLSLFWVKDLKKELILSSFSIYEPNPSFCPLVDPSEVNFSLIPGLAFDEKGYRLGYGKGHYDRLLPFLFSENWAVGFQEQLASFSLPFSKEDKKVDQIALF